jgi:autotransporter-associated beta strand protein
MKPSRSFRSLAVLLGATATLLAGGRTARADILSWWGSSTSSSYWSDSVNWTNLALANAVPANGDNLVFTAVSLTDNTNDLASLSAGWIAFVNGNFTLNGNLLTLSGGITNSTGDNVLALPLVLNGAQLFEADSGSLTFTRVITNNADLTIGGAGSAIWSYVPNTTVPLQGLLGNGNLIVNGNLSVNGGFVYPVNGNNFPGNTIVNNGGVLTISAGCFDNNSLIGQSLTINPGGTVHTAAPHIAGAAGRPLTIYGGTLDMGSEAYFTTVTLSNATLTTGTTRDLRGSGTFTNLASSATTSFGVALNLTSSRTIGVALGTVDPDLDFTGNTSAAIQGTGNLTKVGAGKMRISAPATHTGATAINEGTLALASTMSATPTITVASGAVFDVSQGPSFSLNTNQILSGTGTVLGTVNDSTPDDVGATLSPGGNTTAGTLTLGGLSLSGNALALNFNLANVATVGAGVNDLLIVTNLTLSSGAPNIVNFAFSGTPSASPYTLIQFVSGPAAGPVTTLAAAASRYTYNFTNTGSAILVSVVPHPAPLVWRGDGVTNNWDVAISTNWMNGALKDAFLTGDNATFNDTGSNTPPVNLVGALSANVVTVSASKDYTFAGSGKLSGGSALVKSGAGNLNILTPNDNSGGGSLNGSGLVTVGNGGPTLANIGSGPLTNNTRVTFFENASPTYSGNMSGSGSLVAFMPASTLTLTGTNSFTGGLTVANGTVQIGNATPGSSVTGNITNYGTLSLYRSDAFTNQNFITSAGNTLEYGNGDINVRGAGGMTVDGSGSISTLPEGNLSIGQSAYGKLTLNAGGLVNLGANLLVGNPNGAANYGDVIQNGGIINVGNHVRIGHWATEVSTYTMNGGTLNVPNAQLAVGWDGIGLMTMANGTVNCRTLNIDDNGNTAAISGTNSTFTMTGGQLYVGTGGIGGNTATNALVPTIKLSGGTIGAAAPAGFSSAMFLLLTNGSPTFDTSNSVVTLSGVLSGNGGLVKQGSGYLNLNGANTFTNTATVAAGTLQGSGSIAGPVVVQSGASLSAGTTLAAGTLTVSNVTMNTGAGLTFDLSSTAATGDQLAVKGALALDAVGTPATFNFLGGVPYTGGPYTLITNWLPRTGHLVLAPSGTTRYAATVDETNPNRIQVSFSGANASLVWRGNVNSLWDVNADANWLNGAAADKFFQSDSVIFDSTGASAPNVVLASNMTPASVTVNSTGNYSFSGGSLAGAGTLTKNGAGTLTVSNNVNLTGTITVGGGTLQIGNGGTSGYVANSISDYGSVVFNRSDAISYGVNPVNAGTSIISGPGSVTQAGAGKLTIVSTLNHYGGTTINPGGILQLGNGPVVDSGSLGNSPAINNGTVIFYRLSSIAVATPYSGNGSFVFQGTGDAGQSAYSLNATNNFTGPVTLSYARIQSGAGAQSFGSPSSITVPSGSAVYATAQPYSSVYNIPLTLSGSGWQDGLGALRMEGNGTWAGNVTLAANTRIATTSASTNTVSGTISGNYELETYGNNAGGAVVLTPASANSYNALRVSIGTAGTKTIAGNNNAIPNNIPLTMNGGTLWLNGFSKAFTSFLNLSGSSSLQNGSAVSPATVTLTPVLGASTYNGTFADGGSQPLNVTLTQTPGLWALSLLGASPGWTGSLTNNGGALLTTVGNTAFGNNNAPNRFLVANSGGSFTWNINNVFGNGTANGFFPTIILNPGGAVSNNNYNVIGPVFLNGATLGGIRNSTGYRRYQFRGPITVTGNAPSYIAPSGSGSGDHLDTVTVFNVADVTGNANSDLIVSDLLANRSADYGGNGSLLKIGAGTLELDGANTYSGSTVISNGTLKLGPAASLASPNIILGTGATLDASSLPGGLTLAANQVLTGKGTVLGNLTDGSSTVISPGSSPGTLTVSGDLTLTGPGSLAMDLANVATIGNNVNDLIQVNGALNLSSGAPTPITFNFLNGAPALGTPYTLIRCTGAISGTAATAFTNSPSRYLATYGQSGNSITVTFTGSATNLIWTGTDPVTAATWDIATSTNWSDGTGPNQFYQFDTVRFDDTSAQNTVALNSTVTPTAITVDSTNNYTINGGGSISGSTGITKNNTNMLVLGTANAFTGPVNVNGGVLQLGNNSGMSRGADVTVAGGAQVDLAGYSTANANRAFNIAGSGPDGNGALVNSSGTSIFNGNSIVSNLTLTADAVIGGNSGRWDLGNYANTILNGQGHNLVKAGTCTFGLVVQTITNLSSLTVSNGYVFYQGASQTNAWTAATTNYIQPGATLGNYGGLNIGMPIVLNSATIKNEGGGTPLWSGSIVVSNTSVFNNGAAQVFSGLISGPGGINVGGSSATPGVAPAILTFSNANSYAGGTIISNAPVTPVSSAATAGYAAVVASSTSALGSGPITLDLSLMTTNSTTNVARALEFNIRNAGVLPNAIILPAATTLVTNVGIQGRDSTSVFTLAGQISGGYAGLTNWVDFSDSGSVGVMRLANPANSFIANLFVNRGLLALTSDGALGNSANILRVNSGSGLRFDASGINLAHALNLLTSTTLNVYGDNNGDGTPDTGNDVTISSVISGTAGLVHNVTGGTNIGGTCHGSLTLSGANTFDDQMIVQANTKLIAASPAALGAVSFFFTVNNGATLSLNLNGTYTANRQLQLSGAGVLSGGVGVGALENLSGANVYPAAMTLLAPASIGVTAGSLTLNGVISGNFPLTKLGPAALTLTAANSYNGGTFVNAGTLFLNGSLPVGNAVTVAGGATLGGNGTINGPVTLQAASALQPGVNAIGKLTVNGPLTLAGTTTMEINGTTVTNDAVVGLSTVTYGGTLTVNNLGGTPVAGAKFTLFSAVDHLGSFSAVNLPNIAPLTWNNLLNVDGSIVAVSGVSLTPVYLTNAVSGTNLVLTWPSDHSGWRLLVQTNNLNLGISLNTNDWGTVAGSTTTNQVWLPINTAKRSEFYRLTYP